MIWKSEAKVQVWRKLLPEGRSDPPRSDLRSRSVDNCSENFRKLLSKGKHRNGGELPTHSANADELTERTREKAEV